MGSWHILKFKIFTSLTNEFPNLSVQSSLMGQSMNNQVQNKEHPIKKRQMERKRLSSPSDFVCGDANS